MDASFWHERWRHGEIGFHLARPHPKLCRHWPTLGIAADTAVLVPLCGKSLDMCWLHQQGHAITGIELSQQALAAFVSENQLALASDATGYHGDGWQLLCADWFDFHPPTQRFAAFYDRAALIALPPEMRKRYVDHLLAQLAPGARGLLITLEYAQQEMAGPPFSVPASEVRQLFNGHDVVQLARDDVLEHETRFRERGLTALEEVVWSIALR